MPRADDKRKEYDVLGLESTANEVEVKKAFTRLALRYHPDSRSSTKSIDQEKKIKYNELCKAYKKIMAQNYDKCNLTDWNNDKSDEIFFSLLGELIQNTNRSSELFTLLSAQGNGSKSHFQNDNEYRCKEDAMEDDEEAELNKLVDILKNRLQNGKSVPAGLTQEKLTRLKDDFMKQKEELKKAEKNHHTPTKKQKSTASVPVAKPKPKSKKQLQAEQRRREMEMATIAKELEEKKKKEEEKEQERKKQEQERKKQLDEEKRKSEEEKKRQLNENKKKKDREEKEREQRLQKDNERIEKLKKSQQEEHRKKEEEKRRKAEEKAAKQKSLKETKEREEREKIEKQSQKNQKQRAQNQSQYQQQLQQQQQQQQQQKYPREVPPRFLRQQQMKQQSGGNTNLSNNRSIQDNGFYDNNTNNSQYRDHNNGWTEIVPDTNATRRNNHNANTLSTTENWDLDNDYSSKKTSDIDRSVKTFISSETATDDSSWSVIPPSSEDWDLDIANQSRSSDYITTSSLKHADGSGSSQKKTRDTVPIGSEAKLNKVAKNLFSSGEATDSLAHTSSITNTVNGHSTATMAATSSWGASLTGSSWDNTNPSPRQWETTSNITSMASVEEVNTLTNGVVDSKVNPPALSAVISRSNTAVNNSSTNLSSNKQPDEQRSNETKNSTKPHNQVSNTVDTSSPGITSWAGLDSFDGIPVIESNSQSSIQLGGTKPKYGSSLTYQSQGKTSIDSAAHTNQSSHGNHTKQNIATIDNKLDPNLKVSGWLQNSNQNTEVWDEAEKQDEDFGWTTVKTSNKKLTSGTGSGTSAPNTPSKQDGCNAWTNRALKQLLDMGFKKEQAENALRANNGIIESAVSDLLLKADIPDNSISSSTNPSAVLNGSNGGAQSPGTTPQKLNRKQRRKLQQMQNADPSNTNNISTTSTAGSSIKEVDPVVSQSQTSALLSTQEQRPSIAQESGAIKLNGDGILPTPPASQRIMSNDILLTSDPNAGVIGARLPDSDSVGVIQKPSSSRALNPIGQEAAQHPIGYSRPVAQIPPIQPPGGGLSQHASATNENLATKMTNTDLQPPVNPVLMAQRHLQKLGLEDGLLNSSPSLPISNVSLAQSQAVTNTYIQQYLQRMSQNTDSVDTSMSGVSSLSTPLLATSSMSLSRLLPQPPVPANSLSDGPQKSKLLQWTQPSSASNSEPTTPPSIDDNRGLSHKIDPVSAKWGVVAAPRLSPTPAEFKPGVPWRSRGASTSEGKEEELDYDCSNALDESPRHTPSMPTPPPPSVQYLEFGVGSPSNKQTINEPTSIRLPPGLRSEESDNTKANSSWMVLKGLPPVAVADSVSLRSLCQQFGTLLHLRVNANSVYVCYETSSIAKLACVSLHGKVILDHTICAEQTTENDMQHKFLLDSNGISSTNLLSSSPMKGAHQPQPLAAPAPPPHVTFPSMSSSFGGLWTTAPNQTPLSHQPPPPPHAQQFIQQNFSFGSGSAPSNGFSVNGGAFNHWGMPPPPNTQHVMSNSNQLWGPAVPPAQQPQPSNVFQPYSSAGWLTNKCEPAPTSVFSPGMDRCLPSELLNFNSKEQQGSSSS